MTGAHTASNATIRLRADVNGRGHWFTVLHLATDRRRVLASGDEFEGVDVSGTDDMEVPAIECGDRRDVEAFGDGDHGCVD